jgi:hypothetical protein
VLVICEAKDWKAVEPCIETLKKMKKTVHVCVFIKKEEDMPIWGYAYLLVEAGKDVNIWGFPDKNIRNQLNGLSVDMLLDLTSNQLPEFNYLMLQQPSPFKVGAKRPSGDDMHDFSISMKDEVHDVPYLFGQVLIYLQMIRSK